MSYVKNEALLLSLPWVDCLSDGDYTVPRSQLSTRDGRKIGNAIMVGQVPQMGRSASYLVISDAGTAVTLDLPQLKALFYPPEVLAKNLLPAAQATLEEFLAKGLVAFEPSNA